MKTLIVKPVEPLSLTAAPITSYDIFSYVSTLSTPLPTTVIGFIGAALGVKLVSKDPMEGFEELVNSVKERLKCEDPVIIGPLVFFKVDGSMRGPTIPVRNKLFVHLSSIIKTTLGYNIKCSECFEYKPLVMTGIALKRRAPGEEKSVRKGYMYKYPLVTCRERGTGKVAEPFFIYVLNCEVALDKKVIRVGGESRVAEVYVTTEKLFVEYASKLTNPLKTLQRGVYVAVSPIPLLHAQVDGLYLDNTLGLEFVRGVEGVIGVPQEGDKPPKIIVERLGLGFYEVKGVRRPQILVLPPGTLVKVETPSISLPTMFKLLYTIGFSSLFPT